MVPPPGGCPPAVYEQYFAQLKHLQDYSMREDPQIPLIPDAARPLLSNPKIVPVLPRPTSGLGRPGQRKGNEIVRNDSISPFEPNIPKSYSPSFSAQNELSEIPYTPYLVNNNSRTLPRVDSPKSRRQKQNNELAGADSPPKRLRLEQAGVVVSLLDDNLATEADPSPSPSISLPGLSPEIRHSKEVDSMRLSPSKQLPTSLIIRSRARGSWPTIPSPTPLPHSRRSSHFAPDPDLIISTPIPPRFSPEASENSPSPVGKSNQSPVKSPPSPCLEELPNNRPGAHSNEKANSRRRPEKQPKQPNQKKKKKTKHSSDLSLPSLSSDPSFSPLSSPARPDPAPKPSQALPKPKLKLPSFVLDSVPSIPSAQVASEKRKAKR